MGYQRPCGDVYIPSSWQDHKDRNPPSSEPGTDYAVPAGTPVHAAEAGRVIDRKTSNSYATGRYVAVELDDGRTVRYLHLQSISVDVGARVARGDVLAASGASGNGSDWYYGAHVHTTLWPGGYWEAPTVDFERYVSDEPAPEPPDDDEEDDMSMKGAVYERASDGASVYLLFNEVSGEWSEHTGVPGSYNNAIAAAWQTGSWPTITESHAKVLKNALNTVQPKTPAPTSST